MISSRKSVSLHTLLRKTKSFEYICGSDSKNNFWTVKCQLEKARVSWLIQQHRHIHFYRVAYAWNNGSKSMCNMRYRKKPYRTLIFSHIGNSRKGHTGGFKSRRLIELYKLKEY